MTKKDSGCLYALTVWQPWAWAIGAGMKLVENRDWLPNWRQLKEGDDLAIHGGQHEPTRDDMQAARAAARQLGRTLPELSGHELGRSYGRGRIVAVATFAGVVRSEVELPAEQRPWWRGKFGWLLENVRQLDLGTAPQVLGQQGLWALVPGVELRVQAMLAPHNEGVLWRRTAR